MGMRARAFLGLVAVAAGAASAFAEGPVLLPPPRGPAIGNNAWRGEIRDDGAPDRDLFAGSLAAGDALSVEVRGEAPPDGGPALRPRLEVVDPSGLVRAVPIAASADGSRVRLRRLTADATGRWAVVVSGVEDAEGPYRVRFRVRPGPGRGRARLAGTGPAGGVATASFEALRGSTLDLEMTGVAGEALPPLLDLLDPHGESVPHAAAFLERRAGAWRLHGLSLLGADGTWKFAVGLAAGESTRLRWRVRPPDRPRGTADLLRDEPRLEPRPAPLAAPPSGRVLLRGSGFSGVPVPTVLVDGRKAEVLGVGPAGDALDVRVPPRNPGTAFAVAVVNPDGQACEEPRYLVHAAPGAAEIAGFRPETLRLPAGGTAEVTILLTGLAPSEGTEIRVALSGGVGTAPETVPVGPFASEVSFLFQAGGEGATGVLEATLGRTLALPVRVDPPPPPGVVDLSGWILVQTDSARSFTIPAGTTLSEGGRLILTRDSGRAAFEAFWGVSLGAGVVLLDSNDTLPSFNGLETITLRDKGGALVDGPTLALAVGRGYRRLPGDGPAGDPVSWSNLAAAPGVFLPASGPLPSATGVRIAAFADPPSTGQFVHEFVELTFARHGPGE